MSNLAKIIKQKRTEKNLSPLQVATMLDVDIEDVLRWEEGSSEPSVDILKRLALIFSVSIESFFKEEVVEDKIQTNAYRCLWCDNNILENDIYEKEPYVLCLSCQKEKVDNINDFKKELDFEATKIKKLTKKYTTNTIWISYIMLLVVFFVVIPFFNSLSLYREFILLFAFYFSLSLVSYITLLHFKGFIYKTTKLLIKESMNYPKKLFNAKIKGIVWSVFIKLIFGLILMLFSAVLIIVGSVVLLLLSPIFLPIILINYRRSATYDSL